MNRNEYAEIIAQKLKTEIARLRDEFHQHTVQSCVIDNLLPEAEVQKIFEAFPDKNMMMLKKSLPENKYVAPQMDKYTPNVEEIIYAFQDPRVFKLVEEITGNREMVPDEHLYAGGISLMAKDNFLNPHLDNSHDKNRQMYRARNLLYYVTADRSRCCWSNYYFSAKPLEDHEYFHVTSFRGRPEQPVRDLVLQGDIALRQAVRTVFKKGIVENKHVYKKKD